MRRSCTYALMKSFKVKVKVKIKIKVKVKAKAKVKGLELYVKG